MAEHTISGIATHDGAQIVGLWTIGVVPQIASVDDLPRNLDGPWSVYSPGRGEGAEIALPATTGDELYWAQFVSNDRSLTLGPYPFTLATDRTWDDIMADPAPLPSGGGGGDPTPTFVQVSDQATGWGDSRVAHLAADGTVPLRDDLFDLAADTLTCKVAGQYRLDVFLKLIVLDPEGGGGFTRGGPVNTQVWVSVNGESEAPAYYYYPAMQQIVDTVSLWDGLGIYSFTFVQALSVGDTVQVGWNTDIPNNGGTPALPGTAVAAIAQNNSTLTISPN